MTDKDANISRGAKSMRSQWFRVTDLITITKGVTSGGGSLGQGVAMAPPPPQFLIFYIIYINYF